MEILRASVLVVGIGISLIGAYFIADGITGFVVSQGTNFFEAPQIPIGVIAVVFGLGSIMTSQFLFLKRKNAEAVAQETVEAPSTATVVIEKPQVAPRAETSGANIEKPTVSPAPEQAVITLAETTVSQTQKEVPPMKKKAKKSSSRKKSAKKSSKKKSAKKKSKKR